MKNGKRKNEKMVDFMKRFQYNKIDAIGERNPVQRRSLHTQNEKEDYYDNSYEKTA